MLGRTAGGLFWMFRYLERSDNISRLLEAGLQIARTPTTGAEGAWPSVLTAAGVHPAYQEHYDTYSTETVVNFLLRDRTHPASVWSMIDAARTNARMVRTALTRETWEAMNESWLRLNDTLSQPVPERDVPQVLDQIRRQSALVHGAQQATALRGDAYSFCRLGTGIERAAATARIIDVKYYVLLPSAFHVGSALDNIQWETLLRSVSARQSFLWLHQGEISARSIVDFLVLDQRMPRSLAYCVRRNQRSLEFLSTGYEGPVPSTAAAQELAKWVVSFDVESLFANGLHEFLTDFLARNAVVASQVEDDFRFYR